jgi:hypothetical protein
MDCDKVESAIIDELYGELDEVTSAAVKRHVAGCSRCTTLLSGLRATRRIAVLPLVDPPPDLERRILAAGTDPPIAPVRRISRVVSAAGSWAMRPQSAMAAVFLVMLGASVLLLRGRSSRAPASAEMIVTEKGTPAPAAVALPASAAQPSERAAAPAATPPTVARTTAPKVLPQTVAGGPLEPGSLAGRDRAMAKAPATPKPEEGADSLRTESASNFAGAPAPAAAPPAGRGAARPAKNADDQDTAAEPTGGASASSNGLAAAIALRDSQGCRAAVSRFDEVAQHAAGSSSGWEALLQSARCYRSLGDAPNARARLTTLLGVAQFRDRARSELEVLDRAAAIPSQP